MLTLHEALMKVKAGKRQPEWGICSTVAGHVAGDDYAILKLLFNYWPEFSGDNRYPVPHPTMSPSEAFASAGNKWAGEYGEARLRLLDFLIEETKPC